MKVVLGLLHYVLLNILMIINWILVFFYWRKLHLQGSVRLRGNILTLRASSSEEKVWLEFLPSPLIISFNSGNFFVVGKTFFLSNFLFDFF